MVGLPGCVNISSLTSRVRVHVNIIYNPHAKYRPPLDLIKYALLQIS